MHQLDPDQLEDGFEDRYFYTNTTDGSMRFFCSSTGGTDNTKHSRSELRYMCNPDDDDCNFYIDGKSGSHKMYCTVSINSNLSAGATIIGPIHALDQEALLKIIWKRKSDTNGFLEARYETVSETTVSKFDTGTQYGDNEKLFSFNCEFWSKCGNYFKAGNYNQDDPVVVHLNHVQTQTLTFSTMRQRSVGRYNGITLTDGAQSSPNYNHNATQNFKTLTQTKFDLIETVLIY